MAFPIRFTPLMTASTTQRYLAGVQSELQSVTQAAVTGLSVADPSDAPGEWHGILDLQASVADQPLYQENAVSATSMLATVDATLGDAKQQLDRAIEVAVQMSSETFNDQDRADAALEIEQLREQVIELANTAYGDRYLFAGTAYESPAFDTTGAYLGSNEEPTTVVGDNLRVTVGYDGSQFFPDAIQALDALILAMRSGAGSAQAVQATLDPLQQANEGLVLARSEAGFEYNDAEDAMTTSENLELALQSALDNEIAADPIETYTRLAELQSSYQAALQVTAQSGSRSLFDFLR